MKMVKSLLLGSAAGLVALAGAQAADLPVKAKPVQYVKICSLYGVGFYYIPGTDMCIKIGGWVRAEAAWSVNGSSTLVTNGDVNNRSTNNNWWRIRGYITADARDQTPYGTVRGYIAVGLSTNTTGVDGASNQFDANRAFIQWAGFTFGRAQSFFDFYSQAALGYLGFTPNSDTGDGGKEVFAYTAQFGNGFSASISAESRRTTQIIGQGCINSTVTGGINCLAGGPLLSTVFGPNGQRFSVTPNTGTINGASGGFVANGYGGWQAPDVVGNLRVDQAWGSAQIGGAAHQVNGLYYNGTNTVPANSGTFFLGQEASGHPGDKWGWAGMAGLRVNTPWLLNWLGSGAGDYVAVQGIYTQGALRYIFQNPNSNWWIQDGGSVAYGVLSDGVFGGTALNGTGTGMNLTTAWGINAGYEHFWTPQWRTSLYGGWTSVSYNSQANNILCVLQGDGAIDRTGTLALARNGCNNNWTSWWIGSRTQWNVTKDFYLGLDVAYLRVDGMSTSSGVIAGAGVIPATTFQGVTGVTGVPFTPVLKTTGSENDWMVRFRAHRDFYP
jgi:porin-like protein